MTTVNDDVLGEVTGGFLSVSQWVNYLSSQVMPVLNGLMGGASGNDRAILNTIYGTLQGTVVPNAAVTSTVLSLWGTYNATYRPALQSNKIQVTLDQVLYSAKQYIETHQ